MISAARINGARRAACSSLPSATNPQPLYWRVGTAAIFLRNTSNAWMAIGLESALSPILGHSSVRFTNAVFAASQRLKSISTRISFCNALNCTTFSHTQTWTYISRQCHLDDVTGRSGKPDPLKKSLALAPTKSFNQRSGKLLVRINKTLGINKRQRMKERHTNINEMDPARTQILMC